jgi:hypothetical protein
MSANATLNSHSKLSSIVLRSFPAKNSIFENRDTHPDSNPGIPIRIRKWEFDSGNANSNPAIVAAKALPTLRRLNLTLTFTPHPMNKLPDSATTRDRDWLWDGYLAAGSVTILTSQWKAGKTTLVTGLLQCMKAGVPFLDRKVRPSTALVVSEESTAQWQARLLAMPLDSHVQLLSRPFRMRPTIHEWTNLIDFAAGQAENRSLDLFVVDPLATFLPGRCENDAATLLESLQPLHRLTAAGAAVLLLHHPRKASAEEGHAARGSGALLGFVDIVLELNRIGRSSFSGTRRRLVGLSRRQETPDVLQYEWDPARHVFQIVNDATEQDFQANWDTVLAAMNSREKPGTPAELLDEWPAGKTKPPIATLAEWLKRAFAEKRIRRNGKGVKSDPFRYRLENENDAYLDRGELPPMPDWRFD